MEQEFETFKEMMKREIRRRYGPRMGADFQTLIENNGTAIRAVTLMGREDRSEITISLESYYEEYQSGRPEEDLAGRLDEEYQAARRNQDKVFSVLEEWRGYESVKDRIIYRLVNYERNGELFRQTPFVRVCDLAAVFWLTAEAGETSWFTAMIGNACARKWGLDARELYGLAAENTPRLFPARIQSLKRALEEISGKRLRKKCKEASMEEAFSALAVEPPYVISNQAWNYGAATVLYRGVLKKLSDQVGRDLFLLPSSINEFLALPRDPELSVERLGDIVNYVNRTEVSKREVLSDQVYRYRREKDQIEEAF